MGREGSEKGPDIPHTGSLPLFVFYFMEGWLLCNIHCNKSYYAIFVYF